MDIIHSSLDLQGSLIEMLLTLEQQCSNPYDIVISTYLLLNTSMNLTSARTMCVFSGLVSKPEHTNQTMQYCYGANKVASDFLIKFDSKGNYYLFKK